MRQLSLFPGEHHDPRSEPRVAALPAADPPLRPSRIREVSHGASLVLASQLSSLLREPVEVQLTDNAWTMVSYRRVEGRLHFRLHHMFADAHEAVMRALAGFTGRNRRAHGRAIDEYVRQNRDLIRSAAPRAEAPLPTRGRIHNLADIYALLNARWIESRIHARIVRQNPQHATQIGAGFRRKRALAKDHRSKPVAIGLGENHFVDAGVTDVGAIVL